MTALQDITCRTFRIYGVVRIVGGIDIIPVNLRSQIISVLPQIYQRIVLSLINRRTYQITVMTDETAAVTLAVHVLADKQTPRIVLAVGVE